ncbi:receptor-like protein EIX1 [Dioscorea cayenensis subsp. rotundata]|uniref:Receptor-like protein EIX1 n=1 Tax=Dioscorea cayennensis subsp. rotundata TaxID=55577 RepID=A0AB40AWR2_DIOCR|nr:receptor-like protein EIX1 [Dioscorea cayenensis subsp. rotundata]
MSGELPHCWNQLSWLAIIDLANNNFFGNIPNAIVSLTNLQSLHLRKNGLSRNLPFSLKNANTLVVLHIGENKISGIIPSWIGSLVLDLAQNNFSGVIFPHSFGGFKAMVPSRSERSQLLISKYDQTCYNETLISRISNIGLSCNRLSVTKIIRDMNQLQALDLSINNFSGISALNFLSHLNLSHNKLSGKIPSGSQLQTLDTSAFFYNDGLCGFPLSDCTSKTPAQGSLHGGN